MRGKTRSFYIIVLVAALILCTCYYGDTIYASYRTAYVFVEDENAFASVYSEPSTSSDVIAELSNDTELTIWDEQVDGDGLTWYQVNFLPTNSEETQTGYISSDLIQLALNVDLDYTETELSKVGIINADNVFLRSGAGTSNAILMSLYCGDSVAVLGQVKTGGAIWYHVQGNKNGSSFEGYVYGPYVTVVDPEAGDPDYIESLRAAGFPDSYIPYLVALHEKYPRWEFQAVVTGLNWDTVIEKESVNGINLVPTSYDDSKKSTAPGAYNWETNTWTIYDGNSWVGANPDYIAYYMDPRNFLDETNIYQFEALSYSSGQKLSGVKAIVSGSFLAGTVIDVDGKELNYPKIFVSIGKSTGVSPYLLAARVLQEQGAGTSSMISGTYPGFEGIYNYFNFGASGKGKETVIVTGLTYAKNQGWTSRYKSLLGGATLLGKNYILRGQDTLYFQKFNVVYADMLYAHQYMGNLTAAYTEGRKMANAYTDKDQAFVFRIPVYTNMPDSPVTFTASGNPNNYLKELQIDEQNLTPAFKGSVKEYSLVVDNSVTSITVHASAVATTSTVSGIGTHELEVGDNTIKVKCKSQSGDTRTYKISVYRQGTETDPDNPEDPDNPDDYSISSSKYTIGARITGVKLGTKASSLLKNITATNCTLKVLTYDGKEEYTGVVGTGTKLGIYVDDKLVKKINIVIYGDVNGDGAINALDLIKINSHILKLTELKGCFLQAADANKKDDGVNALDLIATNNHILGKKLIEQ